MAAYCDSAMRVGFGATISTPSLVAVMSQQLNVQPGQVRNAAPLHNPPLS
jgi:protein-L-isoaspartate O-methyltransferase